jgi:toxin ParE1/3/4
MKLRFTPRATQDLTDIADYIRERSPSASARVRTVILGSLQNLVVFPEVGRLQSLEGVRKLVTRKYSYIVYYSLDKIHDDIVILTIQHPAREREYEDT